MGASRYRLYPSVRLCMTLITLAVGASLNGGFAGLNFGIVCMVNETTIIKGGDQSKRINNSLTTSQCPGRVNEETDAGGGYDGEFSWDKVTQSNVLAAHAFGAIVGNIPSGILADRYGSKIIFLICSTVNAVANAVTPVAAYAGVTSLFVVRVIQGASTSASWAPLVAMVSTWSGRSESGSLITMAACGYQIGPLLAMVTSSLMCQSEFRWPMIFYFWSAFSLLSAIICLIFYTDQPEKSRFISERELEYLQTNSMKATSEPMPSFRAMPWRHILTSPPTIAIFVCHFCSLWAMFYVGMFMPTYSKEVLQLDVRNNGLTAALPSLAMVLMRLASGPFSDKITFCGRSRTFAIKVLTAFCTLVPCVFFVLLGFLDCSQTSLAIASFCVSSGFLGTSTASYLRSSILLAPRYAGAIGAVANLTAYVSAVVMPYVVGAMTKHGTVAEWQHTTFLTAGILLIGFVVYELFGSAEEQEWAKERKDNKIHDVSIGNRTKF